MLITAALLVEHGRRNPLINTRWLGTGAIVRLMLVAAPDQRSVQGLVLLGKQVAREANILAFNDVFLLVSMLASAALVWMLAIRVSMNRRGEISPIIQLQQQMQTSSAGVTCHE